MSGKTYLITGANRGIGRGIFEHYAAQPNNTLIAGVRNVDGAQGLHDVPKGPNTKVLITQIDSSSKTDASDAVKGLQAKGIDHIDVVVSSAGIMKLDTLEDMPLADYEEILTVNAIAVLLLYKATLPLLCEAPHPARFVFISAAGGSLTDAHKFHLPIGGHASTKAMANSLVVKMGMENDWLITLCINPGLVQTDMGNMGAQKWYGMDKAPITLEQCSRNTAYIIDNSTKEEHSEKFFDETIDRIYPW